MRIKKNKNKTLNIKTKTLTNGHTLLVVECFFFFIKISTGKNISFIVIISCEVLYYIPITI